MQVLFQVSANLFLLICPLPQRLADWMADNNILHPTERK